MQQTDKGRQKGAVCDSFEMAATKAATIGAADVQMLALDMDGTTLNNAQELTPRTMAALRAARAAGIEVVIATGRPAYVLQRAIDELALPGGVPCVNFNGACAMRMFTHNMCGSPLAAPPKEPELLFTEALDEETTVMVLGACEKLGLCVSYTTADGATASPVTAEHEALLARFEALEGVAQRRVTPREDGSSTCCRHLVGPALKIIALTATPEASAEAARAVLPEGLCYVVAAEVHIEFLRAGVSKGLSLQRLCTEHLEVPLDAVRAYGDNHNDAEMLRLVGQGVAMANAKDAIKKLPGVRVCEWSNDEDGVAKEVELLLAARAAAQ